MQLSMFDIEMVSGFHELLWRDNWDYLCIQISRDTIGIQMASEFHGLFLCVFSGCFYVQIVKGNIQIA